MNIFLVGFMGSGKSNFGKKLANKLSLNFIDLDQFIENQEGTSINQIFSEKGEAYFRKLESNLLFSMHSDKDVVIALGGGAPCSELNWSFIQENGLSIYLKEPESILYGRLKKAKAMRPLIANLSDEELRDFIAVKLKEREVFYDKASFIYEKENTSLDFLTKQLEDYIK